MRFFWCTITGANMYESLKFYEEIVGLKVERRFAAGPGTEIVFLGGGETKIELICHEKNVPQIGEDISVGFEVESLDEMINTVTSKGVKINGEPFSPNPHTNFFMSRTRMGLKFSSWRTRKVYACITCQICI